MSSCVCSITDLRRGPLGLEPATLVHHLHGVHNMISCVNRYGLLNGAYAGVPNQVCRSVLVVWPKSPPLVGH